MQTRIAQCWRNWLFLVFLIMLVGCSSTAAPVVMKKPAPSWVATANASVPTLTPFPNATEMDSYLNQLVEKGKMSGSVLVAQNGTLFAKGYNLADVDAGIPNTPQTRFRIGSNTKQFTAMAILILQERGKLHVQDSICRYVPACPADWQPITIAELLTHSSGIPDYTNFPDFVSTWMQPTTPAELVARFKDMPLDFPPGSVFRYSNSGYVLLGYIIERVSGESYAAFLQQNIFTPLKMNNTGYDTAYPALPQHATGYYADRSIPDDYDPSVFSSAGALYSTVEDLYLWDSALLAGKLVSRAALDSMFTLHMPCPPPGRGGCLLSTDKGYGYGWFIGEEPQGKLIYHVGRIDGFVTFNGFYPERHLIVIVLSNWEATNVLGVGLKLGSMV